MLYLNDNKLKNINENILSSWKLSKLSLHNNDWDCKCDIMGMIDFVEKNKKIIVNPFEIECSNNEKLLSQSKLDLCKSFLQTKFCLNLLFGLIFSLVLLIMLIIAYCHFENRIKMWLYSKNMFLWWLTEKEIDKDKKYDAFISYSHKDEKFVIDELVSKLETVPKPFKLCIHTRDWHPGESIPSHIVKSVEDSKRTIIVLSKNFLASSWGRLEFQAAHKQSLNGKRSRVIVILYGEIGPTVELDPDLKLYLETNTYVKWGDPWFWQKLRYALPCVKQNFH